MVFANALPLIPYPRSVTVGEGAPLRLAEDDADVVTRIEAGGAPESYTIDVTSSSAEIIGADAAGLFYGQQTFAQLVEHDVQGRFVAPVTIADAPRFPYRGVMLDIARHFHGVEVIKGYIDRASSLKFNHLHLHLSDDQGWRLQIDSWPLLTEKASGTSALGDPGGFLSKDDFREILAYAAARHMVVVPEIDLPGHTHAVGVAYPDLTEAPVLNDHLVTQAAELGQDLPVDGEPFLGWGVGHSSVRIRQEKTYDFLRDVLGEVAELTPGPYLHIGGDEALGTPKEDYDYFIERVTSMVRELGKTPIAWHEAGAAEVAEGTIGQFWGARTPDPGHAAAIEGFVARGGTVILSPSDAAYLDMKPEADFPVGLVWAGLIPVSQSYDWEPSEILENVPDDAILGVEAPLWTETARTAADIDRLIFPRAAAQAEIAWSRQAGSPERDWDSFSSRLGALSRLWAASGWGWYASPEVAWAAV